MAFPDAWQEKAFVTITEKDGNDYEFRAFTRNIRIRYGAKDVEGVPVLSGGRILKYSPEADTTITLELYAIKGADQPGIIQLFAGDTSDTTQPVSVSNSMTRKNIRLAILWTEDTSVTSATSAVTAGNAATRVVFTNARITEYEEEFSTDEVLKATVTIKVPPYDANGNSCITWESTDGSDTEGLAALSSY